MRWISRIRKWIKHIEAVASRLSDSVEEEKRIKRIGYRFLINDQLGLSPRPDFLHLRKSGFTFRFHTNTIADYSLLYDLFIQEEYRAAEMLQTASTIIDLGSNVGSSAFYFRSLFPRARILCFEPDRNNYERLCTNIAPLADIAAFNLAVSSYNGEIDFYEHKTRGVSSSLFQRHDHHRHTRVPVRALDTILTEFVENRDGYVDLLKFDVEGAEVEIFQRSRWMNRVRVYVGELHTELMGCSIDEFCGFFNGYITRVHPIGKNRYSFFAHTEELGDGSNRAISMEF